MNSASGVQAGTASSSTDSDNEFSRCHVCSKPALFMCSACGSSVQYCSEGCQKEDWPQHIQTCRRIAETNRDSDASDISQMTYGDSRHSQVPFNQSPPVEESPEEQKSELQFYTAQIYQIIKPVLCCIILSIVWVKISMSGSDYRPAPSGYAVYNESGTGSSSDRFVGSLLNALIIIGQVVVSTFIIVCLFKFGYIKILIGFFILVVTTLLGFMGYLLALNLLQVFNFGLDYITLVFCLYNFAAVGLVVIFWKGPLLLQQIYLTIMSSLMAFSLTGLQEWTTWMLLGLLAIWDLIAVLCPYGPLRMLVESSREQQRDVPALLYSVGSIVWLMATNLSGYEPVRTGSDESGGGPSELEYSQSSASPNLRNLHPNSLSAASSAHRPFDQASAAKLENPFLESTDYHPDRREISSASTSSTSTILVRQSSLMPREEEVPMQPRSDSESNLLSVSGAATTPTGNRQEPPEPENGEDGDERSGLKLGLGDFVFYSVLIARASMSDWITTISCLVAVMTGLNATIFLLAIARKALPALPISIAFGILFYFVSSIMLVPYVQALSIVQIMI
ncbi:Presenilin-domain-containing protein [Basidiobolus meristosporus CBS 931.73]|uniref:Presenilin n=1 Tax=Basidiobolus meristosporus CBS 931.73 TaxID=1314790 RepID=A0A1Y1XJK0_9FUNG|nr:Presenilin-domain-containing protein [Basidiobolus meristosporus CBS 931.73]|eukprot:ORX85883.1 Presenilin-domain-containing protein [Basidiobolus meristosporus CBS 931.73]